MITSLFCNIVKVYECFFYIYKQSTISLKDNYSGNKYITKDLALVILQLFYARLLRQYIQSGQVYWQFFVFHFWDILIILNYYFRLGCYTCYYSQYFGQVISDHHQVFIVLADMIEPDQTITGITYKITQQSTDIPY